MWFIVAVLKPTGKASGFRMVGIRVTDRRSLNDDGLCHALCASEKEGTVREMSVFEERCIRSKPTIDSKKSREFL